MRTRSIRFRLAAWYAVVLACALSLFGGLVWWSLRARLIGEIDRDLAGRASRFEQYFRTESAEDAGPQLRDELEEFCQALPPGSFISISGANGFSFAFPATARGAGLRTTRREFRLNGESFVLEAGEPVSEVQHTLSLLRLLLVSLIPGVILIACAGGVWLSHRALKPVIEATEAAHSISIENLSARLPVPETGDEIARLSEVLNAMLGRLESAVTTLSHFVADASHELRTPLAVIRTTAELALRRARSPEAYRESLQEIAAETVRMTQLVEDLLLLARTDTGTVEMPLSPLDVRDVVRDVSAELRPLARLRRIRVTASLCDGAATVAGNRAGLHRLFLVLLDNALKFSHDGGEVRVTVERDDARVSVGVEDFGLGIAELELPKIFRRFYRSEGGGHGLGLALAESIARAHRAEIEVRSALKAGSKFTVHFAVRAEAGKTPAFSQSSA
jgi:two-component system heavy metal sensor histidine kinase CusS